MGNENKIRGDELVLRKREELLKNTLDDTSSADNFYFLADEFARTKRAKQFFLYLSVLLFIGTLIAATMLMTMHIRKSSKQIAIGISDFESVNLAELLTTAKKNEGRIRGLTSEINDLKRQRDMELGMIQERLAARSNLLQAMNLSSPEKRRRTKAYIRQAALQSARVKAVYGRKIQLKTQRIKSLKKQVAQSGRQSDKTRTAIDNFQRLWDLEKKKLHISYAKRIQALKRNQVRQMAAYKRFHEKYVASLVLRYNPVFEEESLKKLVSQTGGSTAIHYFNWRQLLEEEQVITRAAFTGLRRQITDDLKLIKRLQQISYTNSVGPALQQIDLLTRTAISAYENLWNSLLVTLSSKNYLLKQFHDALAFYARQNREHGYVVSVKNRKSIIVVMNDNYPVSNGMQGIVIRGDRQTIATVDLYNSREGVRARNVQTVSNFRIQPLDKILIKLH